VQEIQCTGAEGTENSALLAQVSADGAWVVCWQEDGSVAVFAVSRDGGNPSLKRKHLLIGHIAGEQKVFLSM